MTNVRPSIPESMRAAVIDVAGPPEVLRITNVPVPPRRRDHVLIALDFASIGTWDVRRRAGRGGTVQRGTILGVDGSGTVVDAAPDVEDLRVGDRVYAFSPDNEDGGFHAEYVSVRAERAARVPPQIPPDVAGAMPAVALTALSALRALHVLHDQNLLVFGASDGVGSLGVSLGNALKARVVAATRPDAEDYVRSLGALDAVDPHANDLHSELMRAAPRGFDAAFVTGRSDGIAAFSSHLRHLAPLAYPNDLEPEPVLERHPTIPVHAEPSKYALPELNGTIGTREIPLRVTAFDLDDIVAAHRRLESESVVGMLVLRLH